MILANGLWKILILTVSYNILDASGKSQDKKNYLKCEKGRHFTYRNLAGQPKILICTGTTNGVSNWQYTDGSPTLGEVFNPAPSCSDIVDNLPEAEDGFYWISLSNTTKQKAWCDVSTDGGGFTLVGMKDSPVSWTVPSFPTPVDPRGPPHWSSVLGNLTVLDFRVQISENKSFKGTKANWLYRLNQKREFGKIFSINNGCTYLDGGIGNVKFVKDLMTQTVVTSKFQCSKFGQNVHDMFGWSKMNYCLRHQCKNGYAVSSDRNLKIVDKFGSFSYSSVHPLSGMNHKSTAFVGCDDKKCCACFGPKGGRQNYCGPKCTAINGGTVMKRAFVWFWVRSRIPERLWKRCMEYTKRNSAGIPEKYFIDPQTGIAHKGSCSEHFKTLLSQGTLTVSDKESFEKIPDVPGLLSYREDNKQLYVNRGSKWTALSSEQEIEQLRKNQNDEVETLRKELTNQTKKELTTQKNELKTLESEVSSNEIKTKNLEKTVQDLDKKVQQQGNIVQTQGNKIRTQRNDLQTERNQMQKLKNELKTQASKTDQNQRKIKSLELLMKSSVNDAQKQKIKIQNQKSRIETLERGYQDVITRLNRIEIQLPITCTGLRNENPTLPSGTYYMSLDNTTFPVHCDMTSKNGTGVTVIGHDSGSKIEVSGYENAESYRRKIKYNIDMSQIAEIISRSRKCEQFVKYECLNAGFIFSVPVSCWISRQGWQMKNWGGATLNSGSCACGMTKTCRDPTLLCNCGLNDNVWAEDSGFLTDKNFLPVTELRFGDTSTTVEGYNEMGYHTLGKLLRWG